MSTRKLNCVLVVITNVSRPSPPPPPLRGRLFLSPTPSGPPAHFRYPNVRAGHYKLAELGLDVQGLIERLCVGLLNTPDGELRFPGGNYTASFVPFHPDALQNQVRHNVLTLMGEQAETIRQPDIDWEIKAASRPYEGLQELANEFGLGPLTERSVYVEIFAPNISAIDTKMSKVADTNADIQVLLAKGLNTELVTLGYRIYLPGAMTNRGTFSGADMRWDEESDYLRGHATLQVPNAAVLNCSVSYDLLGPKIRGEQSTSPLTPNWKRLEILSLRRKLVGNPLAISKPP